MKGPAVNMTSLSCKILRLSGILKLGFANKMLSESTYLFQRVYQHNCQYFFSKIVVPSKINVTYFSRNMHFDFHINLCIFQVKPISYFTTLKNIF